MNFLFHFSWHLLQLCFCFFFFSSVLFRLLLLFAWFQFSFRFRNVCCFLYFMQVVFSSLCCYCTSFFRSFIFFFRRYSFEIYGIFVLCSSIFQVSKFSFFSLHLFGTCLISFWLFFSLFEFGDIFICTFLLAVQSLMYVVRTCVFLGYYSHANSHTHSHTHPSNQEWKSVLPNFTENSITNFFSLVLLLILFCQCHSSHRY